MAQAGWYNDEADPRLARWFDGESWTEHTIEKASWAGPGLPPPPAAPAPEPWLPEPDPTAWLPPVGPTVPSGAATARPSLGDRYRAWPRWARIGAPVGAAIVALSIATSGGADDEPVATTEREVVEVAPTAWVEDLPFEVGDGQAARLVDALCDEDVPEAAATVVDARDDAAEQVLLLEAAGTAAAEACPEVTAARPTLLNEVAAAVPAPTTTTMAAAPATSGPAATTVTTAPRTTTAGGPTVTSRPAPPTTRAPVVTAPPATSPPPTTPPTAPPTAPPSDVYYKNCDAARAAGAAPVYRGEPGYGSHLDRDDDGIGCE